MNILFDFLVRIEKLTDLFGWRREKMRGQNRLTYLVLPVEDQPFFLGIKRKKLRWGYLENLKGLESGPSRKVHSATVNYFQPASI